MKLRWTRIALTELEDALDHIAKDNPTTAQAVAQRILEAINKVLDYPNIGRVGEDEDTREWHVQRTPYLLVCQVKDDTIEILRVHHNKRDRLTPADRPSRRRPSLCFFAVPATSPPRPSTCAGARWP